MPKLFENVKFKGKGHEASDLNKMMGVLEHWGHRLFPRMPFDELIERVERLGQKKAVQVRPMFGYVALGIIECLTEPKVLFLEIFVVEPIGVLFKHFL